MLKLVIVISSVNTFINPSYLTISLVTLFKSFWSLPIYRWMHIYGHGSVIKSAVRTWGIYVLTLKILQTQKNESIIINFSLVCNGYYKWYCKTRNSLMEVTSKCRNDVIFGTNKGLIIPQIVGHTSKQISRHLPSE